MLGWLGYQQLNPPGTPMAPKRKTRPASAKATPVGPIRLQRLLAGAGFGSRRQCEELIEAGRVHVDSDIVTKLGTTVDPTLQKVLVDGQLLKKQKLVYYAVNKPTGVVTTNRDPHGRPRVVDLVPPDERVFPVGRLDLSSEGLILLTNDGELAQRLTHPKYGVRKVYRVIVAGRVDGETMKKMRKGVYIAEGFVQVEGAKLLSAKSRATEMEIVLKEGKNREIRRILARLGHKVQQLRRIAVGPLRLGDMPAGAYRSLRKDEVEKLWVAVDAAEKSELANPSRSAKKRGAKKASGRNANSGKPNSGKPNSGKPGTRTSAAAKSAKAGAAKKNAVTKRTAKKSTERPHADPLSFLPKSGTKKSGAVIGGDTSESSQSKPKKKSKASMKKTPGKRSTTRRFGKDGGGGKSGSRQHRKR